MLWYILLYFTIYFCCVDGNGNSEFFIQKETDSVFDNLSKCIKTISQMELRFKPTVAVDISNIKDETRQYILATKLLSLLMQNNIPTVIISNRSIKNLNNGSLDIEDTEKYKSYGLFVICFETCGDVLSFDFKGINKKTKHLIIVFGLFSNSCVEKVKESVGKYDITFMFQGVSRDQNKLITFIPIIDRHSCRQIVNEPVYINTCFNVSLQKGEIFPSKNPLNLEMCSLKVGMATEYPFSQIKNEELLETYEHIGEPEGSDIKVIKIVAGYFNATIDLYYINRFKELDINNSFIKLILNGSLDVCAGGLFRLYGDQVAYSGIYVRQGIVWIYYVERNERSWANLIRTLNCFYIFVLFYIMYSVIWYIICVFDGDTMSITNMLLHGWGALVGANGLRNPTSLKQKILNIGYMVMCIYFSAYVSIQMYSFLTIREPPQMFNTQEDVMESGRVPYLINELKYFVNDKKFKVFVNSSADCISFPDCVDKILLNNGLTILFQGFFYNFQSATAVNGEARILRSTENILTVYQEMLIRKDSPVAVKFNRVIMRLFEAGITERLFSEAIGILSIDKAASANSNIMMNSYSCQSGCSITLEQFVGIFYTWIFGCVLSIIAFILELSWNNRKTTVN